MRRAVEVESGHACAVSRCGEHTYLELHHINGNREDNRIENLILLCDKHHKMAHEGIIDQKAMLEYKRLLQVEYNQALVSRIEKLEALLAQSPQEVSEDTSLATLNTDDPHPVLKSVASRSSVMAFTLEQLALTKFERDHKLYLERQARFTRGTVNLELDAVRQDDDLESDLVVEVRWLRKRYLDGPIWLQQLEAATEAYELMSGRKSRGIIIFIVPKESMKKISDLPYTAIEFEKMAEKPDVIIYTYAELGFDPGAVSAALFASNVKS
jgi:hypothetical protein